MAETRRCERCGSEFEPKREHARFCSARCRVAWNRENWNRVNRDQEKWGSENWETRRRQGTQTSALGWAITAMQDTTGRLGRVRAGNRAEAFAVIGEAVWWVTIVDATMVRYYPDEYDDALARMSAAQRRTLETMLAGLRFVRNRMGYYADHADFIEPCPDEEAGGGDAPITEWNWRSLPVPAVETLPPRGQEWELSRYEAYQDLLAGHTVGETFSQTSGFLDLVARTAKPEADAAAG